MINTMDDINTSVFISGLDTIVHALLRWDGHVWNLRNYYFPIKVVGDHFMLYVLEKLFKFRKLRSSLFSLVCLKISGNLLNFSIIMKIMLQCYNAMHVRWKNTHLYDIYTKLVVARCFAHFLGIDDVIIRFTTLICEIMCISSC